MPETMAMSREAIFENVREVLEEALGVDSEEITPDATITGDLEAESIDFLDIQFRLEKKFSTPSKPFKIPQGELFPENLMENPAWVSNGKFTDAGMAMLKQRMPHVDFSRFETDRDVNKVGELITVKSLVDFVERKLRA
jgi:acyl carrier protein